MEFIKRDVTDLLLAKIKKQQVIVLTGARQTGKTTLCEELLPQYLNLPFTYITFDDPDERLRFQTAGISILESITTPLVILDEVQKLPSLFDSLKYVVDKQKKSRALGRQLFILTGSSQLLLLKNVKETLAGRVALVNLHPFSCAEVLQGRTSPFLTGIWRKERIVSKDVEQFHAIPPARMREIDRICSEHKAWGGYPPVWQLKKQEERIGWLKDYRKTYVERDILDVGQVSNLDTFVVAQKLLCARTAQILSFSETARDLSLAVNTIKRYVNLLTISFQCYLLRPYYENVGKRFIKSPKIYFPDSGLNRVILGELTISSGSAYESWVFSELIKWKQLQPIDPEMYFYRTSAGMEIDFLISSEEICLPIEAKLSKTVSHADARNIESFMKEHKKKTPLGLIVYPGRLLAEIRKNIWAVPDWFLFGSA